MRAWRVNRGMGAVALCALVSCNSLDVENPNAPDNKKLLTDPAGVEAVTGGTLRGWFNAWQGFKGGGPMITMSRSFAASWNNAHMRYYSSVDNPGNPATTGYTPTGTWVRGTNFGVWQNDPARDERVEVEFYWGGGEDEFLAIPKQWPGFYAGMSAAADVLKAIRVDGVEVRNVADTKRAETVAQFARGLALMGIALNFDKGYIIDEHTDLLSLTYSDRKALRDAAVAAFVSARDSATKYTFTTLSSWTNGPTYTSAQIAQLASTMAAVTLAYYPRDPAEVATQVNWTQVASFASAGISTGAAPFTWGAVGDGCVAWCPEILGWFDVTGSARVNTRVSALLDPDTQQDPWPLSGNPRPNSADKRLGDGSYGDGTLSGGSTMPAKTANGGTDFAWSPNVIMRPDRGAYHQSNIAFVRYDLTGNMDGNGIAGAFGPFPAITPQQNDLIWAEALLRGTPANAAAASALIDKTRVGRGGLPTSAVAIGLVGSDADGPCNSKNVKAKDGTPCSLWSMLLYEKELEILGLGPSPYFEQRRLPTIATCGAMPCSGRHLQGLVAGTPRERPVPAKELDLKGEARYTFGGATTKSPPP